MGKVGQPLKNPELGKQRYREIVEEAIGMTLPVGAVIHHIDENRLNNRKDNFVVCPDEAYHNLLHYRMRARDACGNPNWHKCYVCKQYDDPANLIKINSKQRTKYTQTWYHVECRNEYRRANYRKYYAQSNYTPTQAHVPECNRLNDSGNLSSMPSKIQETIS